MPRHIFAAADRRGVIEFVDSVPDGLIEITKGFPRQIRSLMSVTARHAWDGKTLLVPGVPEADSDDAALDALIRFRDWIGGQR